MPLVKLKLDGREVASEEMPNVPRVGDYVSLREIGEFGHLGSRIVERVEHFLRQDGWTTVIHLSEHP